MLEHGPLLVREAARNRLVGVRTREEHVRRGQWWASVTRVSRSDARPAVEDVVRFARLVLSDVDPAGLRGRGRTPRLLASGSVVLEGYVGPGLLLARALLSGLDERVAVELLRIDLQERGYSVSRRRMRRLRRRLRAGDPSRSVLS